MVPARCIAIALRVSLLLLAFARLTPGQQLTLRTYAARDGLAHGRVNCMHQDRLGYLWFGTWEGLSRFDGRAFVSYGVADGLPNPFIDCIAEDADGRLWVGTLGGGFARLRERRATDAPLFEAFTVAPTPRADDVVDLLFDREGRLWLGTGAGVYVADVAGPRVAVTPALPLAHPDVAGVSLADGVPAFFGGDVRAVVRDGGLVSAPLPDTAGGGAIMDAVRVGDDLFVLRQHALLRGSAADDTASLEVVSVPCRSDERFTALVALHGVLWIGTSGGLYERRDGGWRRYGVAQGLPDDWVRCLFVDADENLWIATHRGGLARLADRDVVSFGAREGFVDCNVARVVEAADGTVYASTDTSGIYEVLADRVERLPGAPDPDLDHVHVRLCCDPNGDFWLGTDHGLWTCPGPRLDLRRCRHLGPRDGLPQVPVCAEIRATADGELWFGAGDQAVYRRAVNGRWHQAAMVPAADPSPCRMVRAAADGATLLLTFDHAWRLGGGVYSDVAPAAPQLLRPRAALTDRRGWTWLGTRFLGVFVDRPAADGGRLHLTTRDGLASDAVWSIAEDPVGRVFFGTARGVSCFEAGSLRGFAGSDRLAGEVVNHMLCDRRGRLWVGTNGGLSCFELGAPARRHTAPRIYLAHAEIDGKALPLPQNGTSRFEGAVLAPDQHHLVIEFTGVDFRDQRPLRYQHRLVGVDDDWGLPMASSAVQFAELAAGSYRLQVRAVDADGLASELPAEFGFEVLPPIWQRPWFVALMALLASTLAWAFHRARLRAAIATERLRTQIATDLHDEVGAGLAQISILSEVARQRTEPGVAASLGEVAALARALRESMSDIVWALARDRGTLGDLVQRMRQLGSRMLEVEGTLVAFAAPAPAELDAVPLSLEQRRQLWLWFKEALTNVARHADARSVDIALAVEAGRLRLWVRDDGVGFAPGVPGDGNGLPSLHARAGRLGGTMRLSSQPGGGTSLDLEVPLGRRPA